ncbi:MAG: hypothetical protein ABI240_04295 [Sphingomonas sp.]
MSALDRGKARPGDADRVRQRLLLAKLLLAALAEELAKVRPEPRKSGRNA